MKKCILLLCTCLLFACSSKQEEKKEFTYILFATPLKEHTIWLEAKEGFDQACDENDIKCDWLGPSVIDTQEMEDVIETGILKKADAIITQGVIETDLIDMAYENNIPIFLVDSDIPDSKRFAYMGKDFNQQAQLLLKDIEEKYGTKKHLKIAIQVAEESFSIAKDQIEEVQNVFKQHEGGFDIVSISESKSDQIRAKKEWEQVLRDNDDIDVAINFAAESAEECATLAEGLGRKSRMLIYGVDDMDTTLQMVKDGKIDGTVVTSFYDYGYKGVSMLLDYIKNKSEPTQKIFSPNLMIVNKENVKNYEEQ